MKAVIPVAGLGTRLLPATKAMPKEMITVVDKPVIQYVVEEAVGAGVEHLLMITGRNKTAIENHFDRMVEMENTLLSKGDIEKLSRVTEVSELADIHYVRQGDPKGLGHAVSKAEAFVGDAPFALLLGDVIMEHGALLKTMMTLANEHNANVIALAEVPIETVGAFGVAEISPSAGTSFFNITRLVEKPSPSEAPSNLVVIGRYVLQPGVFKALSSLTEGVGGEIQLTDALNAMAQNPEIAGPVLGIVFSGEYFDTGDRLAYLKSTVQLALKREELREEFGSWLADFIES